MAQLVLGIVGNGGAVDSLLATTIRAASVLIAVLALVYSVQQVHLMRRENLLPVALDFFREARTPEWFAARDWVIKHLAAECSPDLGVSGLPEPAREHVRRLGFFYDNLGVFVAYRVVMRIWCSASSELE